MIKHLSWYIGMPGVHIQHSACFHCTNLGEGLESVMTIEVNSCPT